MMLLVMFNGVPVDDDASVSVMFLLLCLRLITLGCSCVRTCERACLCLSDVSFLCACVRACLPLSLRLCCMLCGMTDGC